MPLDSGQPGPDPRVERFADMNSLTQLFYENAEHYKDRPLFWEKRGGEWRPLGWRDAARQARAIAKELLARGVKPGDRVAIVSENSPRWPVAAIAIMSAGAIVTPAYTTNTTADHLHILSDSGCAGVIVSTAAIAKRLLSAVAQESRVGFVIAMDPAILEMQEAKALKIPIVTLEQAIESGSGHETDIDEIVRTTTRDDLCCIIYTSGTGGTPKGVMLHHGAILCNAMGATDVLLPLGVDDQVFLSFLPLSHAYEFSGGLFFPLGVGAQIYYAESVELLQANMVETRPTIMTSVPRLYETMQKKIEQGVRKTGGLKEKLFRLTLKLGRKRYETPHKMTIVDKLLDKLCDRLVRAKVSGRFGGRLKAFVSGGAPLNQEIGLFFTSLGLQVLQGYGQTESAPVVSCNPPGRVKIHTVGPPFIGVACKIAPDGEILIKGELVMKGYWNNPDATAETIRDGWLHTGDIGHLDEDGYIQITDRKKDIIVLSGGDNVSPQKIEGFLGLHADIAQCMVYGDKRAHLVALIVPDPEWLEHWESKTGKSGTPEELARDEELRKHFQGLINRTNEPLSSFEKIKRFAILIEGFSIDNGMMTPTLKIRRHKIRDAYNDAIEALY